MLDAAVKGELGQLAAEGHIAGAFPFGSTQFGDANPLSDYDIVIVIDEDGVGAETRSFRAIHDTFKRLHHVHGLPFEVSCYTTEQLAEGLHGFPDVMLSWLKEQASLYDDRFIGKPFIHAIQPKRLGVSADGLLELDEYVDRTRYILKKSWLQGVVAQPHSVLGLVLSTPHVVGRKAVDTLQGAYAISKGTLKDLTKTHIDEALANVFGNDSEVIRLYGEIVNDKRVFHNEFVPQVSRLSVGEYDQMVEAVLEDNLPKCIELLRRMQEGYREIYNATPRLRRAVIAPYVERGAGLNEDEQHARLVSEVRMQQLGSW